MKNPEIRKKQEEWHPWKLHAQCISTQLDPFGKYFKHSSLCVIVSFSQWHISQLLFSVVFAGCSSPGQSFNLVLLTLCTCSVSAMTSFSSSASPSFVARIARRLCIKEDTNGTSCLKHNVGSPQFGHSQAGS